MPEVRSRIPTSSGNRFRSYMQYLCLCDGVSCGGLPVSVERRSLSFCLFCLRQVGHRGTHRPLHNWVGQ